MNRFLKEGSPLYIDLYHLTMAQSLYANDDHLALRSSEAFIRKNLNGGGYNINVGINDFLLWHNNYKVEPKHIDYLRKVRTSDGKKMFSNDFLGFFQEQPLELNISAIAEGELVFPHEPVVRISGAAWQVDMMEAAFLNIFNSESKMATNMARTVQAAKADGIPRSVMDFALRRLDEIGGISSAKAAYIGGGVGTSNVQAGMDYDIPVVGTMAHSFVMEYGEDNELHAFENYLNSCNGNSVLLVDTYDADKGLDNAIQASINTGVPLKGIRIDSGDLAHWSKVARAKFDKAGFKNANIVLSNDLNAVVIESIINQGGQAASFALGTKLSEGNLGAVFKTVESDCEPRMKIAGEKSTIPCAKNIVRAIRKDGSYRGDILIQNKDSRLIDGISGAAGKLNRDILSYKFGSDIISSKLFEKGEEGYLLLQPVVENGLQLNNLKSVQEIRKSALENMEKLPPEYKRLANPHIYVVGLEKGLYDIRRNILEQHAAKTNGR